jgi:hypothetical protein
MYKRRRRDSLQLFPPNAKERRCHMLNPLQVILLLSAFFIVSFLYGWTVREAKGDRIKRFKVNRRYKKPRTLHRLPKCYDWQGKIY